MSIVSLTATPPYDASFAEWSRYEELCGQIDLEIGIPELVRNGDLCPHQDHLILSKPTADALALLERRRQAIRELHVSLRQDRQLLDRLAAHPWLTQPDAHVEDILAAPEMLSASLVLLAAAGRNPPRQALKLLGVSAGSVPPLSPFWLERLLDSLIFRQSASFPLDAARHKSLHDQLHRHGLIEGRRVRLRQTRSVFRLLSTSIAKLASVTEIAKAEQDALGDDLRMVVLSDHIRAGELPRQPQAEFIPGKLGVVPIFETLRRSAIADDYLGVLTGSLVILPRSALAHLPDLAARTHLDPTGFHLSDLPGCPDHVRIESSTGGSAELVRLVTALFVQGHIRILVGTQSLLGEGWDAPALNSLVLASNAASYMLSNQMRGRAIRIDPQKPDKVANIWHLATIDPTDADGWAMAASAFDWGFLNDDSPQNSSDIDVVTRRFKAFEGISNHASTLIEDGVARLGLDPSQSLSTTNSRTFAFASDRQGIAERWRTSLGMGSERSRVRETAAPNYAPQALSRIDTLQSLVWSATASGAFAAANELRGITSFENIGVVAMGLAGAATLATLPRLAKAGRLAWRNGSLEGSLEAVTSVVLQMLVNIDVVNAQEADAARIEVCTSLDGRKDIVLTGVRRATERQVMQAVSEILGPVQNPRYLLLRKSWLGPKVRVDYHAVPSIFGRNKEHAERFAELFRNQVGSSKLLFVRTAKGRQTLLRARARSFAAGFQRSVNRRSVWL